jgi:ubiquinone/menaquinone biosynthesis C-methylase UbiE
MQVVDIGCGPGAAAIAAAPLVPQGVVVGIDPSPQLVRIASRRARRFENVHFQVGTAEDLPLEDRRFDVAWSVHSTHHWSNLEQGCGQVWRVLRQGGRFIVVEPHHGDRPWGISPDEAQAFADVISNSGFADVRLEERKLGRRREFLITASKPAEDARCAAPPDHVTG